MFWARTGVAVLAVVPSRVVLRTPNALSVMLLAEIVDAAAPTRRTPPPSCRFWFPSAWLPVGYGSLFGVGANTLPIGAPVPCTRLDDTVSPDICTEAPAVTRTPSWPKSGPSVSGSGGWIPVAPLPDAWQLPSITVGLGTPAGGTRRVVEVLARVAPGDLVVRQDRAHLDTGRNDGARLARHEIAGRAVDEDADRVVVVDPGVVDRHRAQRDRRLARRRQRFEARDHGDAVPNWLLRKPPGVE